MNPILIVAFQVCVLGTLPACWGFFQCGTAALTSATDSSTLQASTQCFDSMVKSANSEISQPETVSLRSNENSPPYCSSSPLTPKPSLPPPFHHAPPLKPPNPPYNAPSPPVSTPRPHFWVWCVAKPTVPPGLLQLALDYACGSGADCDPIRRDGLCFQPDTVIAHASYAFNSYWQKMKLAGGTCDFGGTAMLVAVDPSYDDCQFIYK